jgi:transcriptional regulator with XRE-family HTH domain
MARTESGGAEVPHVDSPQSALAKAIYDAKQDAGLSQREIGRRMGVDQTVVSTWVRGVATPSVERIVALDRMFGFRPGTLLERAGFVEPRSAEEALAAERAIDDDVLLLERDRLHEVIGRAVAEALALRREATTGTSTGTGDPGGEARVTGGLRRSKSPFDHRQQHRLLAGRSPGAQRATTADPSRQGRRGSCR